MTIQTLTIAGLTALGLFLLASTALFAGRSARALASDVGEQARCGPPSLVAADDGGVGAADRGSRGSVGHGPRA